MYKYLAKIMDEILIAFLDVSKYIFIMLLLMIMDGIKYITPKQIDNIFLYSLMIYIAIHILLEKLCKYNLNKAIKILISVVIVGLSIIIPITFINSKWDMYTFIVSINFLVVSLKSVISAGRGLEKDREVNKFLYSVGIFIIIFIIMFSFSKIIDPIYLGCGKKYLVLYFVTGLMSLARLNLVEEYEQSNSISINKDKNIVRVNIISFAIIIISVISVSLEYVKRFANYLLEKILYLVVKLLGAIFQKVAGENFDIIKNKAEEAARPTVRAKEDLYLGEKGVKELTEEIKDYIPKQVEQFSADHGTLIITIVIIILLVVIGYIIYRSINSKQTKKQGGLLDEEKDFMFSLKDLKDSFRNITDKIQDSLNNKKLHEIRRVYIQCILKLNEKGIKYKKCYTPNEYKDIIMKGSSESKGFDIITKFYNDIRYGNKEVTEEQINTAKKIKDKI